MFGKIIAIIGLASAGLLLILVNVTTPEKVGAMGILAVFILAYASLVSLTTYGIWLTGRVVHMIIKRTSPRSRAYSFTMKKSYYYSTVLALAPLIYVSLRSVGSVSLYELALIALFLVLGCVYVSKRT